MRARLGVTDYRSTTLPWGNPVWCLSQQHNKRTCRLVSHHPFMQNANQEGCEYQLLSHWFDRTRTPESTNLETDAPSTRPSDR